MTSNDAAAATAEPKRKRKFVGFSEQLELKRRERARRNKPRSWAERKLVIPFVFGIAGYTWYVYVGRLCLPMIRREAHALGGRPMGVAFLVVFCILGLMFWWTYIKLLFTAPGFARDHVPKTPAPQSQTPSGRGRTAPTSPRREYDDSDEDWDSDDEYIGGTPYAEIPDPHSRGPHPNSEAEMGASTSEKVGQSNVNADVEKQAGAGLGLHVPASARAHRPPAPVARKASLPRRKASADRAPVRVSEKKSEHEHDMHAPREGSSAGPGPGTHEVNYNSTVPPAPLATSLAQAVSPSRHTQSPTPSPSSQSQPAAPATPANPLNHDPEAGLPPPQYSRRPPTYPVLLPEYRYCGRDGLVKPMRAHHCRVCGTCVLMYDHHCPWIGQCVGARNHKFFVNFLQWSTPWTLWTFATLVALQAKSSSSNTNSDVDAQKVVIIALSAFFSIFTGVLLAAHIRLITLNQSSVESLTVSGMRERERAIMGRMVPMCDWRSSNVHKRRSALREEWDTEWGELNTTGNIWWLGSTRANWDYRMGKNRWGWFLPIGRSEGNGLVYPTNPRFDVDGRWRRRHEWPAELQ